MYAQSVKRRERMTQTERTEYDRAIEWADSMGTSAQTTVGVPESVEVASHEKAPR